MAFNFSIGDIITVNSGFLEALPSDALLRATKETLGGCSSNQLTVAGIGMIGLRPDFYIQVVPDDALNPAYKGGSGSIAYFASVAQVNGCFTLQSDLGGDPVKIQCRNLGATTISKGLLVSMIQPGSIPGVGVANLKTSPAVLGITDAAIAPNTVGWVVVEGPCNGLSLRDAKMGDAVYLGHVAGGFTTKTTTVGSVKVGSVVRAGANGAVMLDKQPGGQPSSFTARTIDGTGNNLAAPTWGTANTQLARHSTVHYADGISSPAGPRRPSARAVSNALAYQASSIPNTLSRSDFVWVWGQYVDHDIGLTEGHSPAEAFNIPVPTDDGYFTPGSYLSLSRSAYDPASNPRQQINSITSFIDASNVYGSGATRQTALRLNDGTGKLKTSTGNMPPFNTGALPNAPTESDPTLYLVGDIRGNEQPILLCMHTLFMREHNRLCDEVAAAYPTLDDDGIYEVARRKVIAIVQSITFNEFLVALLGVGAISEYSGYKPSVNPRVCNIFSTAAYRLGHSMLSSTLRRLGPSNATIAEGDLMLRDGFFDPTKVTDVGLEPYLRGAAKQICQNVDPFTIDEVRNFLFGMPNAGGTDLAALNIQRGRDHGLPGYNQARIDFGLPSIEAFSDISSDSSVVAKLQALYPSTYDIDCWIGGLAEDHLPGSMLGELFHTICKGQFEMFRDGDRFWYQNIFAGSELQEIESTTLANVIRRNTTIGTELPDDVFTVS